MSNVMSYAIGREGFKRTGHPCEKPELLTRRLVEIFTNPGDIVLDSFAGGGTTGCAAFKAGRRAISIEREPNFIAMIERRQRSAEARRDGAHDENGV